MKITRRQLEEIIHEELKLNKGQMTDIVASFDAEDSENVNMGAMINLLSSMPDDDRNEFIRIAIDSNDPDIDVGTLRFNTESLSSWMDQVASRMAGSIEDVSRKIHAKSSTGSSDVPKGQTAVFLGGGAVCDTYKTLSASQVKETFRSRQYRDKKWDGDKLTMISCYATGGKFMSAGELTAILEDQPHQPEIKKKLKSLGTSITNWVQSKQYEPINETKMKITRSQLRELIKEALANSDEDASEEELSGEEHTVGMKDEVGNDYVFVYDDTAHTLTKQTGELHATVKSGGTMAGENVKIPDPENELYQKIIDTEPLAKDALTGD